MSTDAILNFQWDAGDPVLSGEFAAESSGASGELHATISNVTATLAGTAGGAGVSGELHTTLTDITTTLTGTAGGAGVSGELHATISNVTATLTGTAGTAPPPTLSSASFVGLVPSVVLTYA